VGGGCSAGSGRAAQTVRRGRFREHQDLAPLPAAASESAQKLLHRRLQSAWPGADEKRVDKLTGGGALTSKGASSRSLSSVVAIEVQHRAEEGSGLRAEPRRAQMHLQAHHQLFAERIDRRIVVPGQNAGLK